MDNFETNCDSKFLLPKSLNWWSIWRLTNKFSCQVCDEKFTTGPLLKTHIETVHEKKKPKWFESPKIEGENQFSCQICDKKFTTRPLLKTHVETVHENKKPFKCCYCESKFTQKSGMKKHMSMHEILLMKGGKNLNVKFVKRHLLPGCYWKSILNQFIKRKNRSNASIANLDSLKRVEWKKTSWQFMKRKRKLV